MIESGLRSEHKFNGWEFQVRKMSDDQKAAFTINNLLQIYFYLPIFMKI